MKGLARLPELFDQVRNAQRQIDEARSRIKKNEQENRLDQAWIDKNEARIKAIAAEIAKARAEQAEINKRAVLSAGGRS